MFSVALLLVVVAAFSKLIAADLVYPTCNNTAFSWTMNHENQTACQVAVNLEAVCAGGSFTIPVLPVGQGYNGPQTPAEANKCQCSSVTYSMVSACALCQGGNFNSWTKWSAQCSKDNLNITGFGLTLPFNISVPSYAYLNVTDTDGLDINEAMQLQTQPTPPPDSTAVGPTQTNQSSGHHKSHAGAIAGGVVGGIFGIGLILFGALIFLSRRKSRRASDEAQSVKFGHQRLDITDDTDTSRHAPNMSISGHSHTLSSSTVPLKLYDPNDPTTFPMSTPPPPAINPSPAPGSVNSYGMHSHNPSSQFSHSRGPSDVGYKGMPEV